MDSSWVAPNVEVTGVARLYRAASALTAWCTPDMGMSLWGESPLWEDPMSSG